jgi:DNA-binding transcriptional LysR family regulator
MELRHLKSFLAVAELLSFHQAAQAVHLSQPALSAQIQALEEDLGVRLFERDRRSVRLTTTGEAFLEHARATLAQAETAAQIARQASAGQTGLLRIGFVASAAMEIIPAIVLAYRQKYPQVKLELRNLRTTAQLPALEERSIDVGYLRLPIVAKHLTITPVHREPFALLLPANHPLAKKKTLDLSALHDEPFVSYARHFAPGFYDRWISIFTQTGFSPNIVQETGDMYTAIFLVAAGAGLAVIPEGLAREYAHGVVARRLPSQVQSEIGIAVRTGDASPLVKNFHALSKKLTRR